MLDSVLRRANVTRRVAWTVKSLLACGLIALSVLLPQVAHLVAGSAAGIRFLPMYFPVLLGACLLGVRYGAFVGVASPLVSYFLTSAVGNAMPAAARLPFMMAELLAFALVAGAFAGRIETNRYVVFPAVLLAALCGRSVFLLATVLFPWAAPVTAAVAWQQICAGIPGLVLQFLLVPALTILLHWFLHREKEND